MNENVEVHYAYVVEGIVHAGGKNCETLSDQDHQNIKKIIDNYRKKYEGGEGFDIVFDDINVNTMYQIFKAFSNASEDINNVARSLGDKEEPIIWIDFQEESMRHEGLVSMECPLPGYYEKEGINIFILVDPHKFLKIMNVFKLLGIESFRMKCHKKNPEKPIIFEPVDEEMETRAVLMPVRNKYGQKESEKQPAGVRAQQAAEKNVTEQL